MKYRWHQPILGLCSAMLFWSGSAQAQPEVAPDKSAPFLQEAQERSAVVRLDDATFLPGKIRIDGNLDEWGDAATFGSRAALIHQSLFPAADATYIWGTAPDSQGAASARSFDAAAIRLAADENALYVAARVVDGAVVAASPDAAVESGDAIGVALDFRAFDGTGKQKFADWNPYEARNSEGLFGFVAGPGLEPNSAARVGEAPIGRPITGIECQVKKRDFGYEMEVKIPFTGLSLNEGMRGRVTPERLKQIFGVALGVYDRDDARDGASAPAASWTLDSRLAPWGVVAPVTGEEPVANKSLGLMLSPARLENGRRFWRGAAWFGLGELPPAPHLSVEAQIVPTRRPFAPLLSSRGGTPFEARSLAAQAPQTTLQNVQIERYPALGVALVRRDLDVGALPFGIVKSSVILEEQGASRAYFWDNRALWAFSASTLKEEPDATRARSILKDAWWGTMLATAFPLRGEMASGAIIPWFGEQGPTRSDLARIFGAEKMRLEADLVLQRARANPDATLEPDGEPLWKSTVLVGPSGFDLSVPTADLERGPYVLTWSAFEVKDGQRTAFPLGQGEALRPILINVSGPRERIFAANLADAPQLLRGTRLVGSPFRARFPRANEDDSTARGVQDLQLFEGRIYVGGGDWQKNRGPVEVWSFAPGGGEEKSWQNEGSFQEECFEHFRVLDDDGEKVLAAAGIDPQEGWELGNVYFKRRNLDQKDTGATDASKWEKKRTIPNGVLNLDVAKWDGKLWVTNNTSSGARLQSSQDFGQTWQISTNWDAKAGLFPYEMATLPEGVFIGLGDSARGALWQDKEGIHPLLADLVPRLTGEPLNEGLRSQIQRLVPFPTPENPNGLLYAPKWGVALPLCYLASPQNEGALRVEPFARASVRDIVVSQGTVFVLTGASPASVVEKARANDVAGETPDWEGAVYSSRDLKSWTRLAAFQTKALPYSLEVAPPANMPQGEPQNGAPSALYVGLASPSYRFGSMASGDVVRLVP